MYDEACPVQTHFPFKRGTDALVPPREYDIFRQDEPVRRVTLWNGQNAWLITRWQDVREVLANSIFSADPEKPGYPTTSPARGAELKARKTFINMDPPEHTRLRRMLTREFMVKRIGQLRPMIEELLQDLLDDLENKGPGADLVELVSKPLPANVISTMLGVPQSDFVRLGYLSALRNDHSSKPEDIEAAAEEMVGRLSEIIEEKTPNSAAGEDLLSRLIEEQIKPGELSVIEAARLSALLYIAGHETTTNQIGLGMLTLFRNPDQLAKLKANPELVGPAVEEMLRYVTLTHLNSARVATADAVVAGQLIRAGEPVYPNLAAANYDPDVFKCPHDFDISRAENPHMAFAYGVHQCLGQPLARLELTVFFSEIFKRFPNMELAVFEDQVRFVTEAQTLSVVALPVRW